MLARAFRGPVVLRGRRLPRAGRQGSLTPVGPVVTQVHNRAGEVAGFLVPAVRRRNDPDLELVAVEQPG